MAGIQGLRRSLAKFISPDKGVYNAFARAFYGLIGGAYTQYDELADTYVEKGFLYNPVVYSVIKQQADKAKSVPIMIKSVRDDAAKKRLDRFRMATKGGYDARQVVKSFLLESKAFDEKEYRLPLDKPNPLQSWEDIVSLYLVMMQATGNFYLYLLKGEFSGEPLQVYVLPSHLMQIVLKDGASVLGMESPISHYMLIEGESFVQFDAEEVIHIALPNPEFGLQGEHLYGLSPLRAALRNLQSSNEAIDNNNRTLRNSGAFGFIHGKNVPLTQDQAEEIKGRMQEMRADTEALGQIAGASAELAFTRISLTTDELKPFEYLSYDAKQICAVLGHDDKLIGNDAGAKYDNVEWAERRVLVGTVMPLLNLLAKTLTNDFLPLFKSYRGTVWEFDYSEMPEMQQDMSQLVGWATQLLDRGVINRDEARALVKYPALGTPEMLAHTVQVDVIELGEAISNDFRIQA